MDCLFVRLFFGKGKILYYSVCGIAEDAAVFAFKLAVKGVFARYLVVHVEGNNAFFAVPFQLVVLLLTNGNVSYH